MGMRAENEVSLSLYVIIQFTYGVMKQKRIYTCKHQNIGISISKYAILGKSCHQSMIVAYRMIAN